MVKHETLKQIGKQIAQKRLSQNMTQAAIDNRLNLLAGTTKKLETAQINVTIETLEKICDVLGCRLDITIRRVVNKRSEIEEDFLS